MCSWETNNRVRCVASGPTDMSNMFISRIVNRLFFLSYLYLTYYSIYLHNSELWLTFENQKTLYLSTFLQGINALLRYFALIIAIMQCDLSGLSVYEMAYWNATYAFSQSVSTKRMASFFTQQSNMYESMQLNTYRLDFTVKKNKNSTDSPTSCAYIDAPYIVWCTVSSLAT